MVTPRLYAGAGRPFGQAEDLELDFGTADRPALVTALLASCGEPRDEAFWWAQTVGVRIAALLRLLAATESLDRLELQARCREPMCAQWFEFELPLALLLKAAREDEWVRVSLPGGREVSLRRPCGQDLSDWRRLQPASRREAVTAMLDSLLIEGQATTEDEPALAEAMARLDPLVAPSVSCACPVCGSPNEVTVDIEDLVLGRLDRRQRGLLREVHLLASRYGWSEAEVLTIPPTRRSRYLAMIEDGQ